MTRPPPANFKTLLIGISGPSSSGKTTLARLLRSIFTTSTSSNSTSSDPVPSSSPSPISTSTSISLTILHQDDIYLTDNLIPLVTTPQNSPSGLGSRELQDWDCVESLDLDLFDRNLRYVKTHGERGSGEGWGSKEDNNSVGPPPRGVGEEEVGKVREGLGSWLSRLPTSTKEGGKREDDERGAAGTEEEEKELINEEEGGGGGGGGGVGGVASAVQRQGKRFDLRIFIVDGFLLYPNPHTTDVNLSKLLSTTTDLLDLKLFLPSTRSQTISRRTNRSGYVTLEGFWADPPGYVEDVVWPGYLRGHGWMFKNEDKVMRGEVEATEGKGEKGRDDKGEAEKGGTEFDPTADPELDVQKALEHGIHVAPGGGMLGMRELLHWAVEEVRRSVEEVL